MDRKIFKDSFISELAWREFRQHINHYFPYTRAIAFQEKRASIERDNDTDYITAWKE
jgi:deoxyribodipyrimidine photolyase